jgi:hypothetical protein
MASALGTRSQVLLPSAANLNKAEAVLHRLRALLLQQQSDQVPAARRILRFHRRLTLTGASSHLTVCLEGLVPHRGARGGCCGVQPLG